MGAPLRRLLRVIRVLLAGHNGFSSVPGSLEERPRHTTSIVLDILCISVTLNATGLSSKAGKKFDVTKSLDALNGGLSLALKISEAVKESSRRIEYLEYSITRHRCRHQSHRRI
ncbi:hypothetical protein B0J14DRAFT_15771 [Halenospora varia]|nr:hypothetical protein B0J14DRAFT_15771 [Halenospora varia]